MKLTLLRPTANTIDIVWIQLEAGHVCEVLDAEQIAGEGGLSSGSLVFKRLQK